MRSYRDENKERDGEEERDVREELMIREWSLFKMMLRFGIYIGRIGINIPMRGLSKFFSSSFLRSPLPYRYLLPTPFQTHCQQPSVLSLSTWDSGSET
jgi:hypothetical protein